MSGGLEDRARLAHELRDAIGTNKDDWFSMVEPTFVAAGRTDGTATVMVNQAGWQMVHHVDGKPRVDTFKTAAAAVKAADQLNADDPAKEVLK